MKWKIKDKDYFIRYKQMMVNRYNNLGIGHTMATVLMNRHMDYEQVRSFIKKPEKLFENPETITGCREAAEAILALAKEGYHFYVFADYDVDGLTSGYIMTSFLRKFAKADVYYPERREGYGLNMAFCKELIARKEKAAVVTVDNGIAALEPIKALIKADIPVVVTDHHEPQAELPECVHCDPWTDAKSAGHHLCGAGVAFKVCQIMSSILYGNTEPADKFLPYVAVGTIADCMPMTAENMALTTMGLFMIGEYAPNIQYLAGMSKLKTVTPTDVAWTIAPELNACGRMGKTKLAGSLLFAEDDEELKDLAKAVMEENELRKEVKNKAIAKAEKQDFSKDKICLFDASEFPAGIAGIIAGQLVSITGKPAFVYTKSRSGMASASARSNGIDLLPFLEQEKQKGNIVSYGGHAQACGVQFTPDIESFRKSMNESLKDIEVPEPELTIDTVIGLEDIRMQLVNDLAKFPTDHADFPEVTFAVADLKVNDIRSSRNNPQNICFSLSDKKGQKTEIWGWGMKGLYESLGSPKHIDIAGTVKMATFGRDFGKASFTIADIHAHK